MLAVIITGPPGVGKSTVATAVHDRLGGAGTANALIEVDELERCYPPLGEARVPANLAAVCATYRETGYELLFVTATIENDAYGQRLLAAVGAADHLVLRLEARAATLRERIRAHEPANWFGLNDLLDSSARLAPSTAGLRGVDLVLGTEEHAPAVLAARIDAAIGDR